MKNIYLSFLLIHVFSFIQAQSSATDYFRSKQKGNWNDVNTWQSSSNNVSWTNATLVPTVNSNTITIKDSVFFNTGFAIDDLVIDNGGVLENRITLVGSAFTIQNGGAVVDFSILNGGTYLITATTAFAAHTSLSVGSYTRVYTGGTVKVGNNSMVGSNNINFATTSYSSNLVYWENDAIFEWNSTRNMEFANINTTFFQRSLDETIPILKITTPQLNLGNNQTFNTFINGRLETTSIVKITSTGLKLLRGGVINHDSLYITGNLEFNDGYILNDCKLGGLGVIHFPSVNDSLVVDGTTLFTVDLLNNKKISGSIALRNRAMFQLNTYELLVDGRITGGAAFPDLRAFNTHFGGKLKLTNIGSTPVTFPVCATYGADDVYTPATLVNNGIIDNFSVTALQQWPVCLTLAQQQNSVKWTWDIREDVIGGSNVQLVLVYGYDDGSVQIFGEIGPGYSAVAAQIVHCKNSTEADYANGSVNGTTVTATGAGFTSFSPFGITSDAALLNYLPNYIYDFTAQATNDKMVQLNWKSNLENNITHFIIEKSIDGSRFESIGTIPTNNSLNYAYLDQNPFKGTNFYRVIAVSSNLNKYYTSTKKVKLNGINLQRLYPNPTSNATVLELKVDKHTNATYSILNISGQIIQNQKIEFTTGVNNLKIDLSKLDKGIYFIKIQSETETIIEKIIKK
jgi:hypothetical protein